MKTLLALTSLILMSALNSGADSNLEKEALVSISEEKAIAALKRVILKNQNQPGEAELLERLSELYLKQAKSVRFFSLTETSNKTLSFLPKIIQAKESQKPLELAVSTFNQIKNRFPKYADMDRILFHSALTQAQMGNRNASAKEIQSLLSNYPKSEWVPDGNLLIGEVYYEDKKFTPALDHFQKAAASKKPKVAHYGLYKAAWASYNLGRAAQSINLLKDLIRDIDPQATEGFALRGESLRDLALFLTETHDPSEAYAFFSKFASEQETAETLYKMAQIYRSHSKHKEAQILGDIYLKKGGYEPGKILFHLFFAGHFKNIKKGTEQIANLKAANELCAIQAAPSEACTTDLKNLINESADQWWRDFEKTKSKISLGFARQTLEIEIKSNPQASKATLEAYADILFQSEDFEAAAAQYKDLLPNFKNDVKKHEPMFYSFLVSLDRQITKDPKKILPREDFKKECVDFIGLYPKNPNAHDLLYKVGSLEFEDQLFEKAEKSLIRLLDLKPKVELQVVAQNRLVETLTKLDNRKKLQDFIATWISSSQSPARTEELRRLQAKMSLEDLETNSDKEKDGQATIKSYLAFIEKYKSDLKLTLPVMWKALGLSLTQGEDKSAIDLITQISMTEKTDTRIWESTKKLILKETLKKELKETVFALALKVVPKADKSSLLWTYREYLNSEKQIGQVSKIDDEIVSLGAEPERSLVLIERLETKFASGQIKQAFEESKKFTVKSAPAGIRARARLIQAKVLETELIGQSVKTSLQRMQQIITMKLEKLEKAQEAYVQVLQIGGDAKASLGAREGLKRCFENVIGSLKKIEIKDELSAEERKTLDSQIQSLVVPLENKLKELVGSVKEAHL